MGEPVTLETILWNHVISSVLIKSLDLKDKRNLRLVCHAGKYAVDKTVTVVEIRTEHYDVYSYFYTLARSNWAGIKKICYVTFDHWPKLQGPAFIPQQFDVIMKQVKWRLELLYIEDCPADIAAIISICDWPLRILKLTGNEITPKGIDLLMQASWVSTLERFCLVRVEPIGESGARAIAEASYRASNLIGLSLFDCFVKDEEARLLAEGSYPHLQNLALSVNHCVKIHTLAAIHKKCPLVEDFYLHESYHDVLDDPEDARILAEVLHGKKRLRLRGLYMTRSGALHLFTCTDLPKLESLTLKYDISESIFRKLGEYGDRIIAALVQCDCPCLKRLELEGLKMTSEGCSLLSSTEFPALERLMLEVFLSDISLEPRNLPRLKKLYLYGYSSVSARHESVQKFWPHLTDLTMAFHQSYWLSWGLEMVRIINTTNMPSLRVLRFSKYLIGDSDKVSIEEAAATREYKIKWSKRH